MSLSEAERILARAPISTIRLEVQSGADEEGEPTVVLVAVPTMRALRTWAQEEFRDVAASVVLEAQALIAKRRRGITRPDGTCPRCAGPLDPREMKVGLIGSTYKWCPACEAFVQPAGPIVGQREAEAAAQKKARVARQVKELRG